MSDRYYIFRERASRLVGSHPLRGTIRIWPSLTKSARASIRPALSNSDARPAEISELSEPTYATNDAQLRHGVPSALFVPQQQSGDYAQMSPMVSSSAFSPGGRMSLAAKENMAMLARLAQQGILQLPSAPPNLLDAKSIESDKSPGPRVETEEEELDICEQDISEGGDATVYKQVGPVLIKHDLDEAKETIEKWLEFISAEIKKTESIIAKKTNNRKSWQCRFRATCRVTLPVF